MQFVALQGFVPDAPETTPGIVTACDNFIPSKRGLRSAFSAAASGYAALAAACVGAASVRKVDGTQRVFAGTAAKLYEQSSGSWADVTRVSGGNYSSGTNRWRFAQWGDVTIAVNYADTPQYSNGTGAFANLTAMPKAKFVCASNDFIM